MKAPGGVFASAIGLQHGGHLHLGQPYDNVRLVLGSPRVYPTFQIPVQCPGRGIARIDVSSKKTVAELVTEVSNCFKLRRAGMQKAYIASFLLRDGKIIEGKMLRGWSTEQLYRLNFDKVLLLSITWHDPARLVPTQPTQSTWRSAMHHTCQAVGGLLHAVLDIGQTLVSARNWSLRREFLPVKGTPFARSALPRSEHFTLCDLHLTSGTTLSLHLNLKGGSGKRKRSDSDQLLASDTDTTADYTTSYGWLHPANRDWAWRRPTDSAPLAQINVTNRPPTFPIPHLNWFEKVHRCKVGDMPMVSLEELQEDDEELSPAGFPPSSSQEQPSPSRPSRRPPEYKWVNFDSAQALVDAVRMDELKVVFGPRFSTKKRYKHFIKTQTNADMVETLVVLYNTNRYEAWTVDKEAQKRAHQRSNDRRTAKRQKQFAEATKLPDESKLAFVRRPAGDGSTYLELSFDNAATQQACVESYRQATSNEALDEGICASCARRTPARLLDKLAFSELDDRIINLFDFSREEDIGLPEDAYSAVRTKDGTRKLLLAPKGLSCDTAEESEYTQPIFSHGLFCKACLRKLKTHKPSETIVPNYALARGLWIGELPEQLKCLSFIETILIAQYFPRVWLIKLYPKTSGANPESLVSALRGNVCSYEMPTKEIESLVTPGVLPHPPSILPLLVSIAFVGKGQLPNLGGMFEVNRDRLKAALDWLKANNDLYSDIIIDNKALDAYGAVGEPSRTPAEIEAIIRVGANADKAATEGASYGVPAEEEAEPDDDQIMGEEIIPASQQSTTSNHASLDLPPAVLDPNGVPLNPVGIFSTSFDELDITDDVEPNAFVNFCRQAGEDSSAKDNSATDQPGAEEDQHQGNDEDEGESSEEEEDEQEDRGTYRIRPGNQAAADFDPNVIMKSYPTLFPYGCGLKIVELKRMGLQKWIQWALEYADGRFRYHYSFYFNIFGILQKSAVNRTAKLQIKSSDFDRLSKQLGKLSKAEWRKAAWEEAKNEPLSNSTIARFRRAVSVNRAKVIGSDASRAALRPRLWGTSSVFSQPSLWITFNPAYEHDPVAQVICGQDIDLDRFNELLAGGSTSRGKVVSADCFGSAKYFNTAMTALLENVIGIKRTGRKLEYKDGIFGKAKAYYGVVEAQGRGTLHLHLFVWLDDTPNAQIMQERLAEESFRTKLANFIGEHVKAHVEGLPSDAWSQKATFPHPSCCRPPSASNLDDWLTAKQTRLKNVIPITQNHDCGWSAPWKSPCLRKTRGGNFKCKRRAPWPLSALDIAFGDGDWRCKREHPYCNNFNPVCHGLCLASNGDVKPIICGSETSDIIWYCTCYATKGQGQTHNASALIAAEWAKTTTDPQQHFEARDNARRFLIKCINSLNFKQEISGPMVISHLMGWAPVYSSHDHINIYTSEICQELSDRYFGDTTDEPVDLTEAAAEVTFPNGSLPEATISLDKADGVVARRSQLQDYLFRSSMFATLSFYEFSLNTYDKPIVPKKTQPTPAVDEGDQDDDAEPVAQVGKIPSLHGAYLEGHPFAASRRRILRKGDHNNLLAFIGSSDFGTFPSEKNTPAFHAATMLAMFSVWNSFEDLYALARSAGSWESAWARFLSESRQEIRNLVANTGLERQARSAAEASSVKERRNQDVLDQDQEIPDYEQSRTFRHVGDAEDEDDDPDQVETVQPWRPDEKSSAEAQEATAIARQCRLYASPSAYQPQKCTSWSSEKLNACKSTWEAALSAFRSVDAAAEMDVDDLGGLQGFFMDPAVLAPGTSDQVPRGASTFISAATDSTSTSTTRIYSTLNEDQKRAVDIVLEHYGRSNAGRAPSQLLMKVMGEPGTGKSRVIHSITQEFAIRKASKRLVKMAWSGVAGALIGGGTICSTAGVSRNNKEGKSTASLKVLQDRWRDVDYVIVDEISQVGCKSLAALSVSLAKAKGVAASENSALPFGGVNVIILGDFHQIPAIGQRPLHRADENVETAYEQGVKNVTGRQIYMSFKIAVRLQQQWRVKDLAWQDLLAAIRGKKKWISKHTALLRSLILPITHKQQAQHQTVYHRNDKWISASLITPRKLNRDAWNAQAVFDLASKVNQPVLTIAARDSVKGEKLTLGQQLAVMSQTPKQQVDKLMQAGQIQVFKGMRAMYLFNECPAAGLANGSMGTVVDIILDPREPPISPDKTQIKLDFIPACILFKPDLSLMPDLPDLDPGVIPIFARPSSFSIMDRSSVDGKRTVNRLQYDLIPAYAFTCEKSQGQTLNPVIVDIKRPARAGLKRENIYVALSRSSGRDDIRLLRDFDRQIEKLLAQGPSQDLRKDDAMLQEQHIETQRLWDERRLF